MRENGLQRPYSGMQLATWVLHPILVAQFVIFCRPLFPLYVWIPLTSVFGVLAILSATFAYITSKINPMDDRLFPQLLGCPSPRKAGNEPTNKGRNNGITTNPDHTKYCWVCEAHVHIFSMHCKFCDKCVGKFDHHCLWLNTCVGSANYIYFFRTVWVTLLLTLVHFASLVFVVVLYFLKIWGFNERAKDWFDLNQPAVVIGVNIAFLPITLGAIMLLVQLWTFHIGIQWEGITTYQYIVRYNARKRDQSRLEAEINNKRVSAIQRANGDGDTILVCRLQLGNVCRPCDPIRRDVLSNYDRQILHPHGSGSQANGQDNNDDPEDNDENEGDEQLNKLEKGAVAARESRLDKHSRNGDKDGGSTESGTLRIEKKAPSQADSKHQRRGSNRPYDERDEISLEENKPITSEPVDGVLSERKPGTNPVENSTIISFSDHSGIEVSTHASHGEDRDVKMATAKGSWSPTEVRVDTEETVPRTITIEIQPKDDDVPRTSQLAIPKLEHSGPRSVSSTPAQIESSHHREQFVGNSSFKSMTSIPHVIKIPLPQSSKKVQPEAEISPKTVIQDIFDKPYPPRRLFSHQSV